MKKLYDPKSPRRIDRCDWCGQKIHRKDLQVCNRPDVNLVGSNLLLYSSYNTLFWTCGAVDGGATSVGLGDKHRYTIVDGTSITVRLGCQTWSGNGTYRSNAATNVSALTNVVFSAFVGPKQDSATPSMTVVLGTCASDGTSGTADRTWTISQTRRVWFTCATSAIAVPATAYFYVSVTNSDEWFIDNAQLESGTSPGDFVPTSGTAISRTSDARVWRVGKLCANCRKYKSNDEVTTIIQPKAPDVPSVNIEVR